MDARGYPQIIGGSDLLVHARGKNSDLDEWLKDAAEVESPFVICLLLVSVFDLWFESMAVFQEERQNRRDETIGDDLFR